MLEDVARIGPMLVVAGLAVGWVSEAVRRAGGHGFLIDMSIALVGSGIVGGIVVGGISNRLSASVATRRMAGSCTGSARTSRPVDG